jgi:hypothetical protein
MRSSLEAFQSEIKRIDTVANWLLTPPALVADMLSATAAIRCGCVVQLSGYLETFLKDCMCKFIGRVNGLGKPLAKLPPKMKLIHFENGARVLGTELHNARKNDGDTSSCEDLAERLASVKSQSGYSLVWEAFAYTRANPGPKVVKELLNGVGIADPWKKLRDAVPHGLVDLNLFLTSLIEMRNECAHSGNTAAPPTPIELLQYGENLRGLATGIVLVLERTLCEFAAL